MARLLGNEGDPSPPQYDPLKPVFFDLLRLLSILLSFTITNLLLLLLFFLGRIRRSVHGGWFLKYATKISYVLVPLSITYMMGQMHSMSGPDILDPVFLVWAGALIYAYGGVVTMTACELSDNENTLRYVWGTLPLFFWTLWLGFIVYTNKKMKPVDICALVLFLVLATINTMQTLEAFYKASKSKGLPELVEPTMRYMQQGKDVPESHMGVADARSMRGYKYVVWGNPSRGDNRITTTEEIWRGVNVSDEGHSTAGRKFSLANCPGKEHLRDLSLSYAYFRLILRRFAGFPLHESSKLHTRRFVLEGLLSSGDPERVFRVIEEELKFLFDFFYTKSHVCSSYRFCDIWQSLLRIVLLAVFATVGMNLISKPAKVDDFEVKFTRAMLIVFVILECLKYIMVHYSNRKVVWLLCTAIREAAADNNKCACLSITEKRIVWIWTVKYFLQITLLPFLYKPWQRKLGQYSFLKSYGRTPLFARKPFSPLAKLVKLPRAGQKGDSNVGLSTQVKQAIVSSLQQNQLKLSPGTSTIARHTLNDEDHQSLRNSCHLETNAHVILVWHIATTFCESLHAPKKSAADHEHEHEHFLVATQLSKYCAYLLAFSPELLPDHPYITECTLDMVVKQAKRHKIKGLDMIKRYQYLINRNTESPDENDIVVKGAVLAATLVPQVLQKSNNGWSFMAEFWAEMILYLAPSDDAVVHGEHLAKGGEFITHLWALLNHAGVITRN